MKEIPLSRGMVALVDDEDYARLTDGWRWYAVNWSKPGRGPTWYACGRMRSENLKSMHRVIMGHPKGRKVDHRDGNGLNNQRHNLRVATSTQNCANGVSRTPGFKGVILEPGSSHNSYRAYMAGANGSVTIGWHRTAEDAARAYDEAARNRYGEFACVNFPRPGERSALTGEIVPQLEESAA